MCAKQNLRDKIIIISRALSIRIANTVYTVHCLPVMAQKTLHCPKIIIFDSNATEIVWPYTNCKATKINFILGKKKEKKILSHLMAT